MRRDLPGGWAGEGIGSRRLRDPGVRRALGPDPGWSASRASPEMPPSPAMRPRDRVHETQWRGRGPRRRCARRGGRSGRTPCNRVATPPAVEGSCRGAADLDETAAGVRIATRPPRRQGKKNRPVSFLPGSCGFSSLCPDRRGPSTRQRRRDGGVLRTATMVVGLTWLSRVRIRMTCPRVRLTGSRTSTGNRSRLYTGQTGSVCTSRTRCLR
jgi:hypothetical protein